MKRQVQRVAQRVLGFDRYLFWFARFQIRRIRPGRGEGDVLRFVSMLPRDGVALDIGANVGIMTVLIARRVDRGHVHAYEPIPENFAVLERIVSHYRLDNVTLHHVALGETEGELEMVMPVVDGVRMQGLSRVVGPNDATVHEGDRYRVPQLRVDDLPELAGAEVAGIKIDVEDFEQYVLRGALGVLERCRPLVYAELGGGENRRACIELAESLGYSVQMLDGERLVPHGESSSVKHNYFLVPAVGAAQGAEPPR